MNPKVKVKVLNKLIKHLHTVPDQPKNEMVQEPLDSHAVDLDAGGEHEPVEKQMGGAGSEKPQPTARQKNEMPVISAEENDKKALKGAVKNRPKGC